MISMSVKIGNAMAEMTGVVNFYSVGDEFGEFSNFALYPFTLDGERWQTSEHYFQAQKFEDKSYKAKIRKSNSPLLAAQMGRDRKQKLRRDWESVKVEVMRAAVLAKFTQHEELRVLLLSTGDYWLSILKTMTTGAMEVTAVAKICSVASSCKCGSRCGYLKF